MLWQFAISTKLLAKEESLNFHVNSFMPSKLVKTILTCFADSLHWNRRCSTLHSEWREHRAAWTHRATYADINRSFVQTINSHLRTLFWDGRSEWSGPWCSSVGSFDKVVKLPFRGQYFAGGVMQCSCINRMFVTLLSEFLEILLYEKKPTKLYFHRQKMGIKISG